MDTKLVGDISVQMVGVELLKQGMAVLYPFGDRLPYDIAVDLAGRLVRIQVRTAYYDKSTDRYLGNVRSAKTNRKRYSFVKSNTSDVEFFVFVVQDRNVFYVVPSGIVKKVKSMLSLCPHRTRGLDKFKIEGYKNNWNLIAGSTGDSSSTVS